jgi:mannosyltransferase
VSATASAGTPPALRTEPRVPPWWPLAGLVILAAALRFSTLDLQSFWYDEAFTPVHVLHRSLWATLRAVSHTENTPPLWYVIAWADARVLGTGELALRLPSALAGVATVPVAWAIGRELTGRRAALVAAALVAVNPLFVWYSQEARAYGLFALTVALAMLCFLRAEREPTPARLAWFALSGSLALLTHYFAIFLLIPMVLWLGWRLPEKKPAARRATLLAIAALALVGVALLPLIAAQGGHGTQWIGRWALSSRLQAIPQYYLTGNSGAPLGHAVELLVALPILAGLGFGLWRLLDRPAASRSAGRDAARQQRALAITLSLAAAGSLIPVVLVPLGADYLAPRNLIGAMIPFSALLAVLLCSPRAARTGMALAATTTIAFLAISVDVDLSPRLQRGNWRGVARVLGRGAHDRVITTVQLGAAPLAYYLPPLRNLPRGSSVAVREVDEIGYAPLRASAGRPPAAGFQLFERLDIDGLIVYRFVSPVDRTVSEAALRRHVITLAHPEVLVSPAVRASRQRAQDSKQPAQAPGHHARASGAPVLMSSSGKKI